MGDSGEDRKVLARNPAHSRAAPAATSTPFETGSDPLALTDVGADPAVPFSPGMDRPF
jgi:hypothetical protein